MEGPSLLTLELRGFELESPWRDFGGMAKFALLFLGFALAVALVAFLWPAHGPLPAWLVEQERYWSVVIRPFR